MGIRVHDAHFVVRCHIRFSWRLRLLLLLLRRRPGQKLQLLLGQVTQVEYQVSKPDTHLYLLLVRVGRVLEGLLFMLLLALVARILQLLALVLQLGVRVHVTWSRARMQA
jgi:hypothetical protein|tara:strand:- start:185 stop:514 length:330 start_codon:yes stop_codon:yes gene_type:complete